MNLSANFYMAGCAKARQPWFGVGVHWFLAPYIRCAVVAGLLDNVLPISAVPTFLDAALLRSHTILVDNNY